MERVIPKAAAPAVTLYLTLDCSLESVCQKLSIWKKRNNKERPKLVRLSRGLLDQIYPVTVHQNLTAPRLINYLFYWLSVSGCGSSLKVHFTKTSGIMSHAKIQIWCEKKTATESQCCFCNLAWKFGFCTRNRTGSKWEGKEKKKRTRLVWTKSYSLLIFSCCDSYYRTVLLAWSCDNTCL